MRFLTRSELEDRFAGKRVAVVGSAPSVLKNPPGLIDSFDIVVRVNNYKIVGDATGKRTDVHYSFYGNSIRKTPAELQRDGVTLCMAKCPDAHAIQSPWHVVRNKMHGVDFRWIYQQRRNWWFCDTYVPHVDEFLDCFNELERHIPTTGFSAIHTILNLVPRELYLTGFDFFSSGLHNVDERWKPGDPADPFGHRPDLELAWLKVFDGGPPLLVDETIARMMQT